MVQLGSFYLPPKVKIKKILVFFDMELTSLSP